MPDSSADRASPMHGHSTMRAYVTATVAAILYGSWAGFSNWEHGTWVALEACLVQGALSFLSTLTLVLVLEALFRLGGRTFGGFLLAVVGTISLMIAVMTTMHRMAGTPNLVTTIVPSILVGSVFFIAYAWRLLGAERSRGQPRGDRAQ